MRLRIYQSSRPIKTYIQKAVKLSPRYTINIISPRKYIYIYVYIYIYTSKKDAERKCSTCLKMPNAKCAHLFLLLFYFVWRLDTISYGVSQSFHTNFRCESELFLFPQGVGGRAKKLLHPKVWSTECCGDTLI